MMQQVETLIGALSDDREGLRSFAMRRLVSLGVQAVPQVIESLGSSDQMQECAAIVLAALAKDSVPLLVEAMKSHSNRRVRWGAAWVLAAIGADARGILPPVSVPEAAVPPPPRRRPEDVWSDSWLTKIKRNLEEAKGLEAFPSLQLEQ